MENTTRILHEFNNDHGFRVLILTGAGNKAFVSGADISKFESERSSVEKTLYYNQITAEITNLLRNYTKPTIAMIQGFCIGGGLAISLYLTLDIIQRNLFSDFLLQNLG